MWKNGLIAKHWGMLFSTDDVRPVGRIYADVKRRLRPQKDNLNEEIVRKAVEDAYRAAFEERFIGERLSRYGFRSMDQFRHEGLGVFGPELMAKFSDEIDRFYLGSSLNLSFLVYGFDTPPPYGHQHIFTVENPGVAHDCDRFGYGIIGSGSEPAHSTLLAKRFKNPTVKEAVWRLCAAKFSAETAYAVGKETTVIILMEDGKFVFVLPEAVKKIREVYDKEYRAPISKAASGAVAAALLGHIPDIENEGI
jgi:hypothetical protein